MCISSPFYINNNMTPPEGSKIRVEMERCYEKLILTHGSGGVMRFLIAVFLLAWLGGWALGWIASVGILFKEDGPGGFLVFWFAGWTIGGVCMIWFLSRILRSSVAEEIVLSNPTLIYDSGVPPFTISFNYRSQIEAWKKLFKRRRKIEFTPNEIQSLRLREIEPGNCLTIDKGIERFYIGTSLTEVEREWLFQVLSEKYKIEQQRSSRLEPSMRTK